MSSRVVRGVIKWVISTICHRAKTRGVTVFSGFCGIILVELHIDPQLESTFRPKARGLHSIWNAILRIAFSIWFLLQNNASIIEDLQEKNSRTLRNYSRRLQDYSRISWSTFQPREASSTLEDFWLVVLGDA
jgi:hypothetical protein